MKRPSKGGLVGRYIAVCVAAWLEKNDVKERRVRKRTKKKEKQARKQSERDKRVLITCIANHPVLFRAQERKKEKKRELERANSQHMRRQRDYTT